MKGRCQLAISSVETQSPPSSQASWALENDIITISSQAAGTIALALAEVSAMAFDGATLALGVKGRRMFLSKLGADGPTLNEMLARQWPILRAGALRLQGKGEPRSCQCHCSKSGAPPFPGRAIIYDDLMLFHLEGGDVEPLFFPLMKETSFDEASFSVTVNGWQGESFNFSKLGPKTAEFFGNVAAARETLAREALGFIKTCLPSLDAFDQMSLSAEWLPGRLLSLEKLGSLAPGVPGAIEALVSLLPRKKEWAAIRSGRQEAELFLALAHSSEAAGESEEEAGGIEAAPEDERAEKTAPPALPATLWGAARIGERLVLESLSEGDRATYVFSGAEECLPMLSMLLCAPQFSREALYMPLGKLVGERAQLATAARELKFLASLRQRLSARVIHRSFGTWSKTLGL